VVPAPVSWQPVLLGGLFKLNGRGSWARTDRRAAGMAEVERRAERYGLPPIRWPEPWPDDYLAAMRAAAYAQQEGLAREYALAAMSAAFAEGRHLGELDAVLDAAAAAGLDRDRTRAALQEPAVKASLRVATEAAHERGVTGVPTVLAAGGLFWGDDRLEEAARAVQ
jgi:2-hydroxychromene-2-carboxylate isomerase